MKAKLMLFKKVRKSAHCIQVIDRQDIGKGYGRRHSERHNRRHERVNLANLSDQDSSSSHDSSGSDSANNDLPRPPIRPRSSYTIQETRDKLRRMRERRERLYDRSDTTLEKRRFKNARDFVVFEYLENGDLKSLINKLARSKTNHQIPNRVLWSFWLCCKSRTIIISKGTC